MTEAEELRWLSRPAILWRVDNKEDQEFNNSSYWDLPSSTILEKSESSENEKGNAHHQFLSYKDTFLLTSLISRCLRRQLQDILANQLVVPVQQLRDKNTAKIAIPIAVSIPEGPCLPLSVLTVHSLNVPFFVPLLTDNDNDNDTIIECEAFSVLVPLEPGEGKERIRQLLTTTRPAVILCMEPDRERLEDIVSSLDDIAIDSKNGLFDLPVDSNTVFFQTKSPLVLDFAKILQTAKTDTSTELDGAKLDSALSLCLKPEPEYHCHLLETLSQLESLLMQKKYTTDALQQKGSTMDFNRLSHCAFTSGSTGISKAATSSTKSLNYYIENKNNSHMINHNSVVLLASALSFDPCFSDILATFQARASIGIASRKDLSQNMALVLRSLDITHVLCTPSLWGNMNAGGSVIRPSEFASLQVVALGGEPIPRHIVQTWARSRSDNIALEEPVGAKIPMPTKTPPRLYATYGVTESCVYQTIGEIMLPSNDQHQADSADNHHHHPIVDNSRGQDVGKPMDGLYIRVCLEDDQNNLIDVKEAGDVGELVLYGSQLDEWSFYLNNPELSRRKFVSLPSSDDENSSSRLQGACNVCYRTGDRGYINTANGNIVILGRIGGEEGMLKVNGIRVEVGEIEAALVDDYNLAEYTHGEHPVILDAAVVARRNETEVPGATAVELHAYCVVSSKCYQELELTVQENRGLLCNSECMLTLLRARCKEKVRAGVAPSTYILVPRIPLTATGKRHLASLPQLSDCEVPGVNDEAMLRDHSSFGAFLAEQISICLNLQACQLSMLTTSVSFSMLGGDSLAATRIARAIYAHHHNLSDSRFLGGAFGAIDGPFSPIHLVSAPSLGMYADWFLDQTCANDPNRRKDNNGKAEETHHVQSSQTQVDVPSQSSNALYDALMQATCLDHTSLAIGLLRAGADPNGGAHGGRLGKVSGRNQRKALFQSSPLHLACLKGNRHLVCELLRKQAKLTSPDASGSYPLHLAAAGEHASQNHHSHEDERSRLECVKSLLSAGAPLFMKDGNKQTVLHCAARAGNCELLQYILPLWRLESGSRQKKGDNSMDWRDHWSRTPIHWAILNGHVSALSILLTSGLSANPPAPKKSTKRSSIAVESPMELCERLHPLNEGIGLQLKELLDEARVQQTS